MKKYQWSAEVAPRDARELQGSRAENQMNWFFWGSAEWYIYNYVYIYIFSNIAPPTPRTNIAPETRPLENEIPIGNHHFQGPF